jgi:enoyl-CoA hydratase/carnithine racemase
MAEGEVALFERVGEHVAVITLNRPEVRNAVNAELACAVEALVERIETDDMIRAGILTSSNDRVFCAGADLAELAQGKVGMNTPRGGFAGFIDFPRRKPWIAAVRGKALGGGLELCLACDMIVAGDDSEFGLPEVKRSLMAGAGGVHRLPQAIPRHIALEMIATGNPVGAERAAALGLANRIVPSAAVLAAAVALAQEIATNAPIAVRESLAIARRAGDESDSTLRDRMTLAYRILGKTSDFGEGPRAFIEKRAPIWQNK